MKENWYVGCAASQLKSELVSSFLLDKPIVLFRDQEGNAKALLDRCCHRGFPLSKSKFKNGIIECGYHGWKYESGGQVTRIPSQSENKSVPKSYCVPSFPCVEKDGYIWVWAGDSLPGPTPQLSEIHSGNWMQGSRVIECNYLRALEITFDAPHVYFLHPTHAAPLAAAQYGFGESAMELRTTEKGCIVFGPPTLAETDPIPTQGFEMEFILPGTIRFKINDAVYMNFFTMPMGEDRCRMDWTILDWTPQKGTTASGGLRWTGDGGAVIAEDQFALELVQKTYQREGETFERSVETDAPTLLLRRIVKAAELNQSGTTDFGAKRRIISFVGAARFG